MDFKITCISYPIFERVISNLPFSGAILGNTYVITIFDKLLDRHNRYLSLYSRTSVARTPLEP